MTGSAPDRLCPKAVHVTIVNLPLPRMYIREPWRRLWTHLHSHLSVIDEYFPRKKIGPDRCLVARTELLVDLLGTTVSVSLSYRRYGLGSCRRQSCSANVPMERSYILVHQTRLADTAIPEDDNLDREALLETAGPEVEICCWPLYLQKDLLSGAHGGRVCCCCGGRREERRGWEWMTLDTHLSAH